MPTLRVSSLLAAAVLAGCSTTAANPIVTGETVTPDTHAGDTAVVSLDTPTPLAGKDTDGAADVVALPTGYGEPCTTNADCASSLCVHGKDGETCTIPCVDSCPAGASCKQLVLPTRDVQFACLPEHVTLCRPCADAAPCVDGGYQAKAICSDLGAEGSFCLTPCDAAAPCPTGFSCVAQEGGTATYCVPDSGTCECDAVAKAQGLSTACQLSNEHGSCAGTRACGAQGLGPCTGQTPAAESCNQLDDDCDGVADDGFTLGQACDGPDLDGCADGELVCGEGGAVCADDATSVNEACDNDKDDDCDGETDEGCCSAPGSPCCAGGTCAAPLTCIVGECACDQKSGSTCVDGDAWYVDCEGKSTLVKAECGACACSNGECEESATAQSVCHLGDVYGADCHGENLSLVEDCGACACLGGACLENDTAGTTCNGGDVWFTSCDGGVTTQKSECGLCACSDGECALTDQAGTECFEGDAWHVDCFGVPTKLASDCGSCSCVDGACQTSDSAGLTCSDGDAWFTDCQGAPTTKAAECGACACSNGACVESPAAEKVCFEGDVWWTDCDGVRTEKVLDCGDCGCEAGACVVDAEASRLCVEGNAWWVDCRGVPSKVADDCVGCGCSNGTCQNDLQASATCSDGDVHYVSCLGAVGDLKETCGACGCGDAACLPDAPVATVCVDNAVWSLGCMATPTLKLATCEANAVCVASGGSASCVCSTGFDGVGGQNCAPICGDNIKVGIEECDDGDKDSGDGCSSACKLESASWVTGSWSACTQNSWQAAGETGCSAPCGGGTKTLLYTCPPQTGTQTRSVTCTLGGVSAPDMACVLVGAKPASSQACPETGCAGSDPTNVVSCNTQSCCVANVGQSCDKGYNVPVACDNAKCVTAKVDCGEHVTKHCYPLAPLSNYWEPGWTNSTNCAVAKHTYFNDPPCSTTQYVSVPGVVACNGSCQ